MSTTDDTTDDDQENSNENDDVVRFETGLVIEHDSRGWHVLATSDDVEASVHYVTGTDERAQRVTLRTSIGEPESTDDEDGD